MILESHLAVVVANENVDPEKQFGVKVLISSISVDDEYPAIAYPLHPPNFVKIPEVKEVIEVLLPGDISEEGGDVEEVGVNEFPDFCFYTGKVFDKLEGNVPADLLKNYPRRSGWWLNNGTIIYMDDTKGQQEIRIKLTTGNQFISIKDNQLAIVHSTKLVYGSEQAAEQMLKGTLVITNFAAFLIAWQVKLATLLTSTLDPGVAAYANLLSGLPADITTLQGQINAWKSIKHFIDQ